MIAPWKWPLTANPPFPRKRISSKSELQAITPKPIIKYQSQNLDHTPHTHSTLHSPATNRLTNPSGPASNFYILCHSAQRVENYICILQIKNMMHALPIYTCLCTSIIIGFMGNFISYASPSSQNRVPNDDTPRCCCCFFSSFLRPTCDRLSLT